VIRQIETYDVITASKCSYVFVAKAIKKSGIKVVLSGEGADEIFLDIFVNAPSVEDFQKETIERVKNYSQLIY
jgi:asparagine synthase (glutamine-hydrolysing)